MIFHNLRLRHRLLEGVLLGSVVGISLIVVLGWLSNAAQILAAFPGMSLATAFNFVLCGAAEWLLITKRAKPFAVVLVLLTIGLSVAKLLEFIFAIDTGVNSLFVVPLAQSQTRLFAPNTALNFVLIGSGLLLYASSLRRRIVWLQAFVLVSGLVALVAFVGHGYDIARLYRIPTNPAMSLSTSLLFLALGTALLYAEREHGLLAILTYDTAGGVTMRRLLPVAVGAPLLLGGVRLLGEREGIFDAEIGVVFFALSLSILLTVVLWWNAKAMDRAQRERHAFEQAFHQSETRLNLMIAQVQDYAIFMMDPEGTITSWNTGAERIKGYSEAEILGQHFSCLYPSEALERGDPAQALESARREGHFTGEGWRVRKDGSRFWASVAITPLRNAQNNLLGYLKITRDLTERKQSEEALRESELRYRSLFENASDAIFIFNYSGHYLDVNPEAERLTGYSREELLSMEPGSLTPSTKVEQRETIFNEIVTTGRAISEHTLLRKDSSEVAVEIAAINIAPNLYQSIVHDISKYKTLEANLEQALMKERQLNELKSSFVSLVSHEFRTPLAIIQSSAEMLMEYGDRLTQEKRTERFLQIYEQIQRMSEMVEDILMIGKAETVGLEFNPELVNLAELCATVVMELQSTTPHRQIVFDRNHCGEISADPKLLRRAVVNLLTNAIKYSPNGRPIVLKLECGDQGNDVRVQDFGIGIPKADQLSLFQRFQRASNVGEIQGTGLGLLLVKHVAEAHGGTITFESQENVGTVFTIHLPNAESA